LVQDKNLLQKFIAYLSEFYSTTTSDNGTALSPVLSSTLFLFFNLKLSVKTMEIIPNNSAKAILQNVVDKIIHALSPVALRNNSSIVNDIPGKLNIGSNENTVISVITGLLRSVISNARETSIRIYAKEMYGKMVTVFVKDHNSFDTYALACSLQEVVPLAEKIGGHLDITSEKKRVTTVAFRFPIDGEDSGSIQNVL